MPDPTIRHQPDADPPRRLVLVDAVRGWALLGMMVFHLDWDLADFGYVHAPPTGSRIWAAFGDGVAAVFLLLSGVGLVLARPRGGRAAAGRLARVAGAAALVTGTTAWLFPQDAVTFGILHCIVVTNAAALLLLDAPMPVLLAAAGLSLIAPSLLTTGWTEGPPWWWIGVSVSLPRTLDYRPVLPWMAVVVLGVAAARCIPVRMLPQPDGPAWRTAASAGRHSLAIYLLHQPVLFGLLWLATLIVPVPPNGGFTPACVAQCRATGAGEVGCAAACACAERQISQTAGTAKPNADAIARACIGPQP